MQKGLTSWLTLFSSRVVSEPCVKRSNFSNDHVSLGCGSNMTELRGRFHTPGYPSPYPSDTDCSWLISLPHGYVVKLFITDLNIGNSIQRCFSYEGNQGSLTIYDGPSDNGSFPLLARYCGNAVPPSPKVVSTGNEVFVRFKGAMRTTVRGQDGRGFFANYSVWCGGHLTAKSYRQFVHSVSFSTTEERTDDCSWLIESTEVGQKVELQFTYMSTAYDSIIYNCSEDYIEVYDGPEAANYTLLGRICGQESPTPFISTGNTLFLWTSFSTWSTWRRQFSFSYYLSDSSMC
ncbi:unnamed protein product [Soboliphyme baturini]|uniref:CUB domain-containing protein n=1 Tax=Soboliphyme baturini TaxID=241478 RepID=A0A183IE26_9BILA|nr:unnamed protein product [Soboliphyme baturini]